MIRLISCACAIVLCLAASQAPAKEGCGSAFHTNNNRHRTPHKKGQHIDANGCRPTQHMGANGHCHHN